MVPKAELEAVNKELVNHIRLTRNEDGCITFEVHQDNTIENRFNVYEEFATEESFKLHQSRVKNSVWGKVSANVERKYKILRA